MPKKMEKIKKAVQKNMKGTGKNKESKAYAIANSVYSEMKGKKRKKMKGKK